MGTQANFVGLMTKLDLQTRSQNGTHLYMVRGEGNGTPLQDSCLENPMDGGAW